MRLSSVDVIHDLGKVHVVLEGLGAVISSCDRNLWTMVVGFLDPSRKTTGIRYFTM